MNLLKTVIIEDDTMASKGLSIILQKFEEIQLIEVFEDAETALPYLLKNKIDLMFLDVEMPGMSGLELLDKLEFIPQIIMTTSNKEYAYDAFEFGITDFLIKPINLNRVQTSISKVKDRIYILSQVAQESSANEIYLRVDGKYTRIPIDEILYFENVGDYIKAITDRGNFIIHGALKNLDERLNHPRLLKVHRSFIVNISKIKDIDDTGIVLENNKLIPVSRAHKPTLMNTINVI